MFRDFSLDFPLELLLHSKQRVMRFVWACRGFTLAEVVVAIAVLMACLVGIAPLFTLAPKASEHGRRLTIETLLALGKLEELRDAPPLLGGSVQHSLAGFCDVFDAAGRPLLDAESSSASFVRRWSLEVSPERPSSMIVLRVSVAGASSETLMVMLRRAGSWR